MVTIRARLGGQHHNRLHDETEGVFARRFRDRRCCIANVSTPDVIVRSLGNRRNCVLSSRRDKQA
jgi:hypothetical protein